MTQNFTERVQNLLFFNLKQVFPQICDVMKSSRGAGAALGAPETL